MTAVRFSSLVVRQHGIVHHLQQNVEDVRMRLLDLVEQQHAVRCFADGIGEQSAVVVAHITCRRTDQFGHSMLFRIFTHIEAHERQMQFVGQHPGHLRFTYTGRSHKEQTRNRFVLVGQSGLGQLHRFGHSLHGLLLSEDALRHPLRQMHQFLGPFFLHCQIVHLADPCQNLLNQFPVHTVRAVGSRVHFSVSTRLVNEVNGFVRQEAVVDKAGTGLHGISHDALIVSHSMEFLIPFLQSLYNGRSLFHARFGNVNLLEAAHQSLALGQITVIFLISGGSHKTDFPRFHIRLQQVGRIERTLI